MKSVVSFDIFDTVLTRRIGAPRDLFLLLGQKLKQQGMIEGTAEAFAEARVEAERSARKKTEHGEVQLPEIYRELGAAIGFDESRASVLMEEECRLESEMLRPVPETREEIRRVREHGKQIAFLSDMYLPLDYIREQLRRHGLAEEKDLCYVSGHFRKSKVSGALFEELLKSLKVRSEEISHKGDHLRGDVEGARKHGIKGVLFSGTRLNRYEAALAAHCNRTAGISSLLAGASRLARLSVPAVTECEKNLRDVAAGVMAPVLTGYLLWLLKRIGELGIKRVYFVARDGQILYRIIRRLAAKLNVECDFRYLYGSRQAWHVPALTSFDPEDLSWIAEDTTFLSIEQALGRVSLRPQDIAQCLNGIGYGEKEWSRNLTARERRPFFEALLQDADFQRAVNVKVEKRRGTLLAYLRQEGLLDPVDFAVVDIGWQGRLLNSLNRLLQLAGGRKPVNFYFGLSNTAGSGSSLREAYFFNRHEGWEYSAGMPGIEQMIEMFCAADHGLTIDYAGSDGKVIPVLRSEKNQNVLDWGLPVVHKTVDAFLENLFLDGRWGNPWTDLRPSLAEILKAFWLSPTAEEARAWGGFPSEDDHATDKYVPLAAPYGFKQAAWALANGAILSHHRAEWRAGSLRLTPPAKKALLLQARNCHRTADKVVSGAWRVLGGPRLKGLLTGAKSGAEGV